MSTAQTSLARTATAFLAYGRSSPCPTCQVGIGSMCMTETGRTRGDHPARRDGAGPQFPARTVHIDHPACGCRPCTSRQARCRTRDLDQQHLQAQVLADANTSSWLVPAQMSATERLLAPCYVCEAPIGQGCQAEGGSSRVPHPARGTWGAWKIKRGTEDIEVMNRYRAAAAPVGRLVATQQQDLLKAVAPPPVLMRIPSPRIGAQRWRSGAVR